MAVAAFFVMSVLAPASDATTLSLTQAQLLLATDVTALFGGNGQVLSRVADGNGVLFEIEGGTTDYGKVGLRYRLYGDDLTGYTEFGLHFDVVTAPNPIELNPFVQTGSIGLNFVETVPGEKMQGDSFDAYVPLTGIPELDIAYGLGFQYFTASGTLEPESQIVWIRVSPIGIPEPGTLLLLSLSAAALGVAHRVVTHDDAADEPDE